MKLLLALVLATITVPLLAQTSPREFANGPAKWLMTADEQKAWRSVKTDDEAIDFIDLFWARRDPTPGTGRNENRLEFETRVAYADAQFKEGKTRGALTERGRVLIVLGFPTNMGQQLSGRSAQYSNEGGSRVDPTGGRSLAEKDTWEYDHELSVKYGMPKIDVVFLYDRLDGGAHRDPQRTDFTSALPGAIRSYIKSPGLTTVPDWASSRLRRNRTVVAADEHVETTVTLDRKKGGQIVIEVPKAVARPAGAGRMMLLNDSMVLRPENGLDPFEGITNVVSFPKGRELGWAAQYCSGRVTEDAPPLKVEVRVTAPNGDSFSSDPEEFVPDSIKAYPGCYLLRGSLELTDMEPGAYRVSLTISPAGVQSYNLVRDFTIQ